MIAIRTLACRPLSSHPPIHLLRTQSPRVFVTGKTHVMTETTTARATSLAPAVNGRVIAQAEHKFRYADVRVLFLPCCISVLIYHSFIIEMKIFLFYMQSVFVLRSLSCPNNS